MEFPRPTVLRIPSEVVSASYPWRDAPPADFAVIGDPVSHSKSPAMHQAVFQALGLDYRYRAIHVPTGEVSAALDHLAELGYWGVNVTVPHKQSALEWATEPDSIAQRIGATNTLELRTRAATNTDAGGFMESLKGANICRALVLGAGGSARAVCIALRDAGVEVCIWNRSPESARALADEFGLLPVESPQSKAFELVVNATSASLQGSNLPIEWSEAVPGAIAYDLVYGVTPFLVSAKQFRFQVIDGSELLVAQGARSFEWWTGLKAPRDVMREAIG